MKNKKFIKNYMDLSEVLNKYFTKLTKSLKFKKQMWKKNSKFLKTSTNKINQPYPKQDTFPFREIHKTEIPKIIKNLPKSYIKPLQILQ